MTKARSKAGFLVVLAVLSLGAAAGPPCPAVPDDLPAPRAPIWGPRLDGRPDFGDVDLGVGHLVAASRPYDMGAEWVSQVLLPLWDGPDGVAAGWLAHGYWFPADGEPRPLSTAAMIETGYALVSFVVTENRPDGWFELRFSVEGENGSRSAWSHSDHLGKGGEALVVESWETYLEAEEQFRFRKEGVPHTLRAAPSADAEPVTRIGADHDLELLEVDGDWMRVRVVQPAKRCRNPATWEGTEDEGWIRWRDTEKGPWVWPLTRGC